MLDLSSRSADIGRKVLQGISTIGIFRQGGGGVDILEDYKEYGKPFTYIMFQR